MHLVNITANISVELFIYQAALKNLNFSNLLCTFNLIIYCPLVFHFILFQMLTVEHVDLNSISWLVLTYCFLFIAGVQVGDSANSTIRPAWQEPR